jgi:hypothetical protein
MFGLARTKPRFLSELYLVAAVLAVFLSATAPVRSYEFEITAAATDAYYASPAAISDCLAVVPKIGQNSLKSVFSPLRMTSLRLFILFGTYNAILAFFKSRFAGNIRLHHFDIKNSISLKLRI